MRKRTAALLGGLAFAIALAFSGFGRAKTYSTLSLEHRREVDPLPPRPEIPAEPDLVIERSAVIAASPDTIFDVLTEAQKWTDWDHGVTRVNVPARRPLADGDHFTKVERGFKIEAEVLDAEPGELLRWRGLAPGKIVGVHSFQLVPIDEDHTLVVNREEFSNDALRLFGWVTDFGLGKRFDRTLEGLKATAEARSQT